MKRLVVTGDDFGRSRAVNRAIIEAHERGILTSASLMIGAPAAAEAVELARAHPDLAVGLHLVVVDGAAALPRAEIPRLVDADGIFRRSPFWAGVRYQFSRAARRELEREIRAQLERFRETGLPLSHVDGHHHMHLHPFVLGVLIELSEEFGIRWIRLPREELRFALAVDRHDAASKILWRVVFQFLQSHSARRLRAAGIGFADRVYGLLMTGRVSETSLLDLIPRIRAEHVELYCHPIRTVPGEPPDPQAAAGGEELAALVSAAVRESLTQHRFALTSFLGAVSRRIAEQPRRAP